jgi:hypothetical protein
MANIDKIIDRIQKLRALAESTNVHEAAAAAAAAQTLMDENRVSEAQLQAEGDVADEPVTDTDVLAATGFKTPVEWMTRLASGVAIANGCRISVRSSTRPSRYGFREGVAGKIRMWGQQKNLDAATYIFHMLRNEIERLASRYDAGSRGATISFKLGAAVEISERVVKAHKESMDKLGVAKQLGSAPAGSALMVINRGELAVEEAVAKVTKGGHARYSSGPSNIAAFHAGKAAGGTVNLGGKAPRLGSAPKQIA